MSTAEQEPTAERAVEPTSESQTDRDPAPAVTRSIRILGILADAQGRPMPLSDIARAIGAAKSSTSNLCAVLEESGLIQRVDSGFTLGHRTVELGGAYLRSFDQVREFYRFIASSEFLSHEVVQIAMLDGTDVLYLARHEGRAPLRLSAGIGDRFPAAPTAVGNALLAHLAPEEVDRRFADGDHFPVRTERSTTSLEHLQEKLALVRERGYAIDDGEVHPGVFGIARWIPPRASGAQPLAIGASLMEAALTPAVRAGIIAELAEAVSLLSNPMVLSGR
ncbi:IclR family transcriptional regulator [Plantibacter sp. YIM 135249]|uniref:IclR family transcriptional regulator n=1 Tax=Plantibacter sp. YIM 135249 TaxID=3423918 RepID=UPI003D333B0E